MKSVFNFGDHWSMVTFVTNEKNREHLAIKNYSIAVSKFITQIYNPTLKTKLENNNLCSICLEYFNLENDEIIEKDVCFMSCCSNSAHIECLNNWILSKIKLNQIPTCFLCREQILQSEKFEKQYLTNSFNTNEMLINDNETNNFELDDSYFKFELDILNEKYLIYNLDAEEILFKTFDKADINIVKQYVDYEISIGQIIKTMMQESGDIVNTIMVLTM